MFISEFKKIVKQKWILLFVVLAILLSIACETSCYINFKNSNDIEVEYLWQDDVSEYINNPKIAVINDIEFSLDVVQLGKCLAENNCVSYYNSLKNIYTEIINANFDVDGSFQNLVKVIDICLENNLYISVKSWQFDYLLQSVQIKTSYKYTNEKNNELLKKANLLRYRAINNIKDNTFKYENGLPFDFTCTVRISMEFLFFIVLLFSSIAASVQLPSEYNFGTISQIYRSPRKRTISLLTKISVVYVCSLLFAIFVVVISVIVGICLYGPTELSSYTIISLPINIDAYSKINIVMFWLILAILQSFESLMLILLCMAVSTWFIKPIPAMIVGLVVSVFSGISCNYLIEIREQEWMRYFFAFTMNIKQYFEFNSKYDSFSFVWCFVSTLIWMSLCIVLIFFSEKRRDI